MTKRLIDVDDDALDAARAKLGTSTIKDTVNEATAATPWGPPRRPTPGTTSGTSPPVIAKYEYDPYDSYHEGH